MIEYDLNIDTELNICIDSDDCMAEGAVSVILNKWKQVKDKGYAGLIGLDANFSGEIIGKGFPKGMRETTLAGYYASGGAGDKKLVYRTDIIKKYPPYPVFSGEKYVALAYKYRLIDQDYKLAVIKKYPPYPVFSGEKYVALAYKYRLIDQDYKLAVIDQILCNVEYQADGSSGTMWKQYLKYPKGFAFWRKICMQYPENKKRLFVDSVHYVSSSLIARDKNFIKESPRKIWTIFAIIPGVILTVLVYARGK